MASSFHLVRAVQKKVNEMKTKKVPHKRVEKPQDMANGFADGFKIYAQQIRQLSNASAYPQNHPELGRWYVVWRETIANWAKGARKHLKDCPDIEELPILTGHDYNVGLISLAEHCEIAEGILRATTGQDFGSEPLR